MKSRKHRLVDVATEKGRVKVGEIRRLGGAVDSEVLLAWKILDELRKLKEKKSPIIVAYSCCVSPMIDGKLGLLFISVDGFSANSTPSNADGHVPRSPFT